jgi:UDP-N-acetylglucosamine--N-acetylmuramyl-(pentapeptide) pyrophosphoryl-undecaprenol N-acetylglucosamine transferase
MRVVFAGGGTGGHIFPGIAVARALERISREWRCEFWGVGRPVETSLFEKEAVRARVLPAAPMPKNPLGLPRFACKIAAGYFKARSLLKQEGISVVVGLGSYSSFAPVLAARHMGLPTVLLEQNVIPGKATRKLAAGASAVCATWPECKERLPAKTRLFVTGNPVRRGIVEAAMANSYRLSGPIVVLGGSTGAVGLNTAVIGAVETLRETERRIVHQTGQSDYERVKAAYKKAGVDADVRPFFDDMAETYTNACLLIARGGGTTLAEAALFGIPSVLIPYPHHGDLHQRANAEVFEQAGAAQIIEENSAAPAALGNFVRTTLSSPAGLDSMHAASLALGRPEAADAVAAMVRELAEEAP